MAQTTPYMAALVRLALLPFALCAAAVRSEGGEPAAPSAEALADSLESLIQVCAKMEPGIPRDTFDPPAVAEAVGPDPEKLFAWVRDRTRYVPYEGVLRGPAGVLMDRSGNSLDRSLLLARLLQLAGHHVRLARGKLDDALAEEILRLVWDDPKSGAAEPAAPVPDAAAIAAVARQSGLDPREVEAAVRREDLRGRKATEDLVGSLVEQTRDLTALLPPPKDDDRAERAALKAALADHWWVQREDSGRWVDLDPLRPDAKPGDSLNRAMETVEMPADGKAALPANLYHEIQLRVVVERWEDGRLESRPCLQKAFRPADIGPMPLTLTFLPIDWPEDLDWTARDAGAALRKALLAVKEWAPLLEVGDEQVLQQGFDDRGAIDENPPRDSLSKTGGSVKQGVGRAAGLFEAAGPPPKPAGELTAVWLELEVRSPGRAPRVFRRDVYDLFGPGKRAAGSLAEPRLDEGRRLARSAALYRKTAILAAGCIPSEDFVFREGVRGVLQGGPKLLKALREAPKKSEKETVGELMSVRRLPAPLFSLAAARRGPPGLTGSIALDRPNLFALHVSFRVDPRGAVRSWAAIDIIANEVAFRGAAGAEAFRRRLVQGILEAHLERAALGRRNAGANPSALFAASHGQGIEWIKIESAADPALSRVKLWPNAMARIRADLDAGSIVVAPVSPVRSGGRRFEGWWSISRDGTCIGYGPGGMGVEFAERMMLTISILQEAVETVGCIQETGRGLACAVCAYVGLSADMLTGGCMHFGGLPAGTAAVGGYAGGLAVGSFCRHVVEGGGGGEGGEGGGEGGGGGESGGEASGGGGNDEGGGPPADEGPDEGGAG